MPTRAFAVSLLAWLCAGCVETTSGLRSAPPAATLEASLGEGAPLPGSVPTENVATPLASPAPAASDLSALAPSASDASASDPSASDPPASDSSAQATGAQATAASSPSDEAVAAAPLTDAPGANRTTRICSDAIARKVTALGATSFEAASMGPHRSTGAGDFFGRVRMRVTYPAERGVDVRDQILVCVVDRRGRLVDVYEPASG